MSTASAASRITSDIDGCGWQMRPMSSAALQEGNRIANVTFDHALSQNATYTLSVSPFVDPLSGAQRRFESQWRL